MTTNQSLNVLFDEYLSIEKTIWNRLGYTEDWRRFPMMDHRDQYWTVESDETVWFTDAQEDAESLIQHNFDYDAAGNGDRIYSDTIYTYRHLSQWVFANDELTMILVDTHTDLNVWLAVFDTTKRVIASATYTPAIT